MKRFCQKCLKACELGQYADIECGHQMHYKCMDEDSPDFERCLRCRGEELVFPVNEPANHEGHDYVRMPIAEIPVDKKVEKLFVQRTPIEQIIVGEDLGLQKLLHHGVTIDTFVRNGYTWKDLVKFQDLHKPGEARIAALFALKCTAEHFRDYPDQLPVKELGVSADNLVADFGLQFGEQYGPLGVVGGHNGKSWNFDDLHALGVGAKALYKAGLYTYEQIESMHPSEEQIAKAGFSQYDLDALWPPKRVEVEVERPRVVYRAPPAKPKTISIFGAPLHIGPKRYGLKKK